MKLPDSIKWKTSKEQEEHIKQCVEFAFRDSQIKPVSERVIVFGPLGKLARENLLKLFQEEVIRQTKNVPI